MREVHSEISRAILKALLYSDIWHYPLTEQEIYHRLDVPCSEIGVVRDELLGMIQRYEIFRTGDFYSLRDDISLALRRQKGNKTASQIMSKATRRAQLIFSFPFVRSVMISGSLSKNYFDEKSDIDYFVVTEPGKVWLTRGLMTLYKRMFLGNSHKYFCVNYYIDSEHLLIEERNIFTATELATVLPACGASVYRLLAERNQWIQEYYPQFKSRNGFDHKPLTSVLKITSELALRPFAKWLDKRAMKMFTERTRKVYGAGFTDEDFNIAFKSTPYVSKNHLDHYQKKVTTEFNQKVDSYFSEMVTL